MARTTSAKPQANYAQSDAASPHSWWQRRRQPSLIIVVTLFQSLLLVSLAITFALQAGGDKIISLLALLSLATAAIVAYSVLSGSDGTGADHGIPLTTEPAWSESLHAFESEPRQRPLSNAEQFALLKAQVSHELRTPLNAVIGFSEMMHREVLGPVGNDHYREYAGHIRNSAQRFLHATENTLAVTELLAAPPRRCHAPIALGPLALACIAVEGGDCNRVASDWTVDIEPTLEVEGNAGALRDAIVQILAAASRLGDEACATAHKRLHKHIAARPLACGLVELRIALSCPEQALHLESEEQTAGIELSLFLARLGLEASGATLRVESGLRHRWHAVVTLPLAAQRELQLA